MTRFLNTLLGALNTYGEKVAIVDKGGQRQTSYHELYNEALRVAASLQKKGFEKGSCITVSLPQSMEYIAAEIGCWMRGCIAVPISDTYPQQRVEYIERHCEAKLRIDTEVIRQIENEEPHADFVETCEEDIISIYYTSGSTGEPKGVMHTYEGFFASRINSLAIWELTDHDVIGHSAPLYFCASTTDYDALTIGTTVHLYSEEVRRDVQLMAEYIKKWGITRCFMSPTVVAQYHNISDKLELVMTASERLSGVKPDGFRLKNFYGSTEISTLGFCFEVDKAYDNTPIGKPAIGVEFCIQDDEGNILPDGEEGEICLRGCFTPGYYKDPEKTAQLWRESPQADSKGNHEKWLHTKDIGMVLPDGNMLFVNRKDWMVKISGQRVEPGEVEAVMKHCAGVKNAIVKGFQNKKGGNYICGYYILEDGSELTEAELENFMRQYLTDYMIPTCFQRMDSFPLNPNGKLDRKSLVSPLEEKVKNEEDELTSLETEIKDLVARLLQSNDFSATDNLGYQGLTSILATKLASAIYNKYGVQVDVRRLVKSYSVKTLAAEISGGQGTVSNESETIVTEAPLTASQIGIYADCIQKPDSMSYNTPHAVAIPEGVTVAELEESLRRFVAAHAYLDSCFSTNDDGDIRQRVRQGAILDIPVKELTEEEFKTEKKAFVRPFDLEHGPLYRFEIVRVLSHESQQAGAQSTLHLLFDFHHLIFDGASTDIFLSQLCTLLDDGTIDGERYDYYHFANEQQIDSKAEEFFDGQMSQIEEASALLPDVYATTVSEPAPETAESGEVTVATNLEACREKCRELNITSASLYLAATMIAVSKYVAEDTVGICTISNGRSNSRIADSVGMFVNTLPVVSTINGDMHVDDYLRNTAETFSDTIANEQFPFARIAERYGFTDNILFAYQVGLFNNYKTSRGTLTVEALDTKDVQRPLTVLITGGVEPGDGKVTLSYDRSLFTDEMMQGFASAISNVAQELLCRQKLSDIEICNETQTASLDAFNNPVSLTEEEQNATVVSMFKKMAKAYPDNVAVVFKDKHITYRELDEQTDRIAVAITKTILRQAQHGSESKNAEPVVSIIIHRNEWMVLASLAALKAGCAYQPLDPSYPQERLNFMVKDAGAALLIAEPDLRPLINEYEGEVLLTTDLEKTLKAPADYSLFTIHYSLRPSSLLTLLYTSGSTGVPKGVMIEHRNLVAFTKSFARYNEYTPESRVAAYASFGFDANMMDVFCTLMVGAAIHIIDESIRLDLIALYDYFEREGITNCFMTTQVGVQYMGMFPQSSSLKHLIMGGEKLRAVKPEGLSYSIHNGYGPSETTCGCALFHIKHWEPNIPIGKPLETCSLYIVDKYGHRLPVGAPGELWISGPQVSRGYLNRPEKTAESFTENPFGGGRVYHSGDIVRYRHDGNIEFVGRKDGQVKIRGFRVELKEVEAVILEMPEVKDVTVQAFENPQGGKFIAAYIVMNASCLFNADNISDFIRDRKPPYMVPTSIMELEKIPLTVNQKVDKKALPTPVMRQSSHDFVAPADELEITIADAFVKVLGLSDKVSVTDNFSDLGGDSIKAIRLLTALRQKNITLLVNQILQVGTVRGLADIVRASTPVELEREVIAEYMLHGENIQSVHPLSESQIDEVRRIVLNPDIISSSVSPVFMLRELGDKTVLDGILTTLYDREEYLRSTVAMYGVSVPRRIVSDKKPNLLWYDFSEENLSEREQIEKVNHINDLLQRIPYLPQDESPLRIALVKSAEDTQYLVCCFHTLLISIQRARMILIDLFRLIAENTGDSEAKALIEILEEAVQNDKDNENDNQSASTSASTFAPDSWLSSERTLATEDVHTYSEHPGKKKLFFFHTGSTGSEAYFNLARRISDQCSFYVFEQYNLNHPDSPILGGIPEIAARYIEILRTYQPHGPYLIGGWCYGGTIAYEIAQQLVKAGEQIEHVIMLDSNFIDNAELRRSFYEDMGRHNREYLSTADLFAGMRSKGLLEPLIRNAMSVNRNCITYEPKPYNSSPVTYFKAVKKAANPILAIDRMSDYIIAESAGGYEKIIPSDKLTVFNVPEEHDSMMLKPSLDVIVPEIIKIIKQ